MKTTAFLVSCLLILLTACDNEDEVNIVISSTTVTEAFPYASFKIQFSNPDYRVFEVFFDDQPSLLNGKKGLSGSSDGMLAVVPPTFTENTEVQITLKAEGKTFTAPAPFKIKALPKITYVSTNKIGFRQPLKVVIKNKEYFNNGTPELSFCAGSTNCYGTGFKTKGDTLVVTPSLTYGSNSYQATYTLKVTGVLPVNTDYNSAKPLEFITSSNPISFRPTFKLDVYKGKAGDSFKVVFDNAKYFADQMTLKFGETTITPTGIEIAAGEGYTNPLVGFYKIPNLLPGTYNISVTDKDNMEYLPEAGIKFVVE